ncbi:MAG: AraC family transcriptional regulator [Deltaproteobacteria bacterium]|nr:AraC family transcriptional regulator [Deltaproteobacteria bacterium]
MTSATVSIRMIWPFTRILKSYRVELEVLREAGIEATVLANPDARIPHALAWKLMQVSIDRTCNPLLGLLAGRKIEVSDWGIMAHAAVNCSDLRQAMRYCGKYIKLLDDLGDIALIEQYDKAIWQFRYKVVRPLAAVNDYLVSSALTAITRFLGRFVPPIEVHVIHPEPDYANEYMRILRAPVRYNAEYNAVVIAPSLLDRPVALANTDLFTVFDKEVKRQFDDQFQSLSASVEVQRLVIRQLGRKGFGINEIAKQVHMSAPTLKRRLSHEGTSYSEILDDVRKEFALRYLSNQHLSIEEVAIRLGFSSASAFGKAFKRWLGVTPVAYRMQAGSR